MMRFDAIVLIVSEDAPNVFLVNVEVQNERRLYLWFTGRVYAYIGRLLDSQKDDRSGFPRDEYQYLKPLLALWTMPHEDETYIVNFPLRECFPGWKVQSVFPLRQAMNAQLQQQSAAL